MNSSKSTSAHIEDTLRKAFEPTHLDVEDESWKHQGHSGPAPGEGHFNLLIVSETFAGKSLVQRHRIVYDALAGVMYRIHALSIRALSPEEWNAPQ